MSKEDLDKELNKLIEEDLLEVLKGDTTKAKAKEMFRRLREEMRMR